MLPYYSYKFITKLIRPFIALYILIRISKGKEDRSRVAERYGLSDIERKKVKLYGFTLLVLVRAYQYYLY